MTIVSTKLSITEISAPIPAAFDDLGLSFFQVKNKISPTSGTKNPNTPHPNLLPSGSVTTFV